MAEPAGQPRMRWSPVLLALLAATAAAEHIDVCTAPFPPMSMCNASAAAETYSGFDIALFRRAAQLKGWVESSNASLAGTTYSFTCMLYQDMIRDLTAPNGNCTLASAGITISSEREEAGIVFSYPTYRSAIGIMVYSTASVSSSYFFLKPFSWEVWLAIALTVIAVPCLTFLTEFLSIEGRVRRQDVLPGMQEAGWRSCWTMLLMEPFHVRATASRIIAILFGFLAAVLINTYCANLAAALTVSQLSTPINSVDDLRGKAVGTIPVYVPRLSKFGIAPYQMPFDGVQSAFADWLPKLRDGVLLATAVDEPVQQYVAAEAGCAYHVVASFAPFDFGLAWRIGTNNSLVDDFDRLILALQEDGTVSQLRTTFVDVPRKDCDAGLNQQAAITFDQVSGLWVILGVGTGLALLWLAADKGPHWYRRRKQRATVPAGAPGAGSEAGSASPSTPDRRHRQQQQQQQQQHDGAFQDRASFRDQKTVFDKQLSGGQQALFLMQDSSCEAGLGAIASPEQRVELLLADARAEMARVFDRLQSQVELARQ